MSDRPTTRLTVDLDVDTSTWLRVVAAQERVAQAGVVRAALQDARKDPDLLARWVEAARQA